MTFLEALPDELRNEVINQHLREQTATTRSNIPNSILHPDFLAALPLEMRQQVLGDLEQIPVERIIREPRSSFNPDAVKEDEEQKPVAVHKESVPVLSYSALIDLLKIVFLVEPIETEILDKILGNVSENSKTRSELFGLLISILTGDGQVLNLVDKNFSSLTLKSIVNVESAQVTPTLVAQRCLETMFAIVTIIPSVAKYFLTELDNALGKTPKSSKKGKAKVHAVNYPVVILLNLLDKSDVLQNSVILEPLILLLSQVLRPLSHIAKKKFMAKVQAISNEDSKSSDTKSNLKTPAKIKPNLIEQIPSTPTAKDRPDIRLPYIPTSSVRLVIRILRDSACSSKTFQSTLSIILYLSSYPEYLNIITRSLLETAQFFAETLLDQLDSLISKINSLTEGGHIDAAVLNLFTSPGAPQIRLLRVLKTLDFLFSQKHGSNIFN